TVFLRKAELPAVPALFYRVTYCLAAACFLQIALGGFVAASGASLACPDFPLCYGALLPLGYGPSAVVQMTHRGLGLVVLLLAAWACLLAPKDNASAYGLKRTAHGMFWLIVLQIAAGAGTVLMSVPVHLAVTHLLLAQIILLKALFLANCQNGIVRALAVPGAAAGLEHTFATDLMPPQEAA
ncbi:MAG TPA: COX15/CtaA family protein, partial [Oligoflexia bacterium]|nr:COX15/CtaA family protein [Oligoflexia bacterium]